MERGYPKLVLTGGPCAGKTTARNYLYEKLSDYGWGVLFVPEVATTIITSGVDLRNLGSADILNFQKRILQTQLYFEDELFHQTLVWLKPEKNKVMICDRGCMDNAAYMNEEDFDLLLFLLKLDRVELRDKRYDAVFHLMTAAEGKSEFYNLDNPARHETPEQAVALDIKTRQAWLGHPHLRVIDNSTDFDEKMKRLLNAVRKQLGIPVAIETERKFLVHDRVNLRQIPVPYQRINIEQVYLGTAGARLRRRSQEGASAVYYKTVKLATDSARSRVEIEKQITADEFHAELVNRDTACEPIYKERVCFLWKNQYFELDIFTEPARLRGLTLLEIELTEENDKVEIPDWLGKVTEVTEDPKYSNRALSKRPT